MFIVKSILIIMLILRLLKLLKPNGVILSGGPNSILDKCAPNLPRCIQDLSKPILGICYGLQLLVNNYGGKIKKSLFREYGHARLKILHSSKILPKEWKNKSPNVWMSHGDSILYVQKNFKIIAKSNNNIISIIENKKEKIFGLQFHPEVHHTKYGQSFLSETLYLKFAKLNIIGSLKIL